MLSCLPGRTPTILLVPVRDGELGQHLFVELTGEEPSTTVTVTIRGERELGLALAWSSGLASREAQGTSSSQTSLPARKHRSGGGPSGPPLRCVRWSH